MKFLTDFVHSRWYWFAILCVAAFLESVGLFYQHVLGEPPCVLCVRYRAWILFGVVFALVGLLFNDKFWVRLGAQLGVMFALVKMFLTTHTAVLIERGLYDGTCGMDPEFPTWLPLDKWLPNVFEVWTMCGYTPNFLFGLSMGEGMYIANTLLGLIALAALVLMLLARFRKA